MALVASTSSLGGLAGSNALARLLVVISGDSRPLQNALASAQGSLKGFNANASAIGSALIRSVTLPILALGGAAIFMASQFQSAMGRVAGLTPILDTTGQSIGELGDQLLEMSQEVPTAPTELANALYFAGSAGLDAATAMDIVRKSAEGAAIGMGEASDIAKVLIFAMNNYGSEAFNVTTAMDALTAAVREGTAEPEEMAIALGRLLPVAKEAGITFEEVVGSVAALTNLGMPARVATTSLRALFAQLLGPTRQGEEAMRALGLTAEQVLDVMRTTGPIGVFGMLDEAVNGDERALRDILPQIRAYTAYLGLTNDEMEDMIRIFEATTNSTGALAKAFRIISQTPQFQFDIGINKLRVAAIKMGAKAMPIFLTIVDVISSLGDAIANLPDPMKTALVGFLALAAAAGPLIKLWATLGAGGTVMFSTFGQISSGLAVMGLAAVGAYMGFQALSDGTDNLLVVMGTAVATFTAVTLALKGLQTMALGTALVNTRLGSSLIALGSKAGWVGLAITGAVVALGYFIGKSNQLNKNINQMGDALYDGATGGRSLAQALRDIETDELREDVQQLARDLGVLNQPVSIAVPKLMGGLGGELIGNLEQLRDMLLATNPPMQAQQDTVARMVAGFNQVIPVIEGAVEANKDLGPTLKSAGLSGDSLVRAVSALTNVSSIATPEMAALAEETLTLIREYPELAEVMRKYNQDQQAAITATVASEKAVDSYARELGVSSEYLASRLNEFGISAVAMDETTRTAFEDAAGVVDKSSGEISIAAAEMEANIAEAVAGINESVRGSFAIFEKLPEKVKQTTAQLVHLAEQQANMILEEAANLRILAERGVPTDVLAILAEQGPGYVAKFVDASDRELQRLITAVQVVTGATTDEILSGVYEFQQAGTRVVQEFTTAMLNSSQFAADAAADIVRDVTVAFSMGNISGAGVRLAQQFARGIASVRGLSRAEAAEAMNYFVGEIQRRDLTSVGRNVAAELTRGLQSEVGLTKAAARRLVESVLTGARTVSTENAWLEGKRMRDEYYEGLTTGDTGTSKGTEVANEVVGGLNSGAILAGGAGLNTSWSYINSVSNPTTLAAAYDAGLAISHATNQGLEDGAKNSPKYYGYYLGQRVAKSFGEGMNSIRLTDFKNFPGFAFPGGSRNQGRLTDGGRAREVMVDLDLDVRLDRSKVARDLEWEYSGRGR